MAMKTFDIIVIMIMLLMMMLMIIMIEPDSKNLLIFVADAGADISAADAVVPKPGNLPARAKWPGTNHDRKQD